MTFHVDFKHNIVLFVQLMVCGTFLIGLLFHPQLVGLLLIVVAAWGKGFGIVSSIHIIGGVIAVGFFLLLISIVGLIGAVHHHQVMLFFVSFSILVLDVFCSSISIYVVIIVTILTF